MATGSLEQRVRVGIIGGMFDKGETLLRAAQPLIDEGHEVEVFESNWFKRESGENKLRRAENFLDELRPEVIYGASAGGLLAVVAGFQKEYLHRISTAAAPLHRPRNRENTPKLRAVTFACPSLRYMRDEFYRRKIHGRLNDTDQEILIVTGSIDEIVPLNLSRIEGYRAGDAAYKTRSV